MASRLVQKVSLVSEVTCDVCKQSLDYEVDHKEAYVTLNVVPAPWLQIFQQWPLTLHIQCLIENIESLAGEALQEGWGWMKRGAHNG